MNTHKAKLIHLIHHLYICMDLSPFKWILGLNTYTTFTNCSKIPKGIVVNFVL